MLKKLKNKNFRYFYLIIFMFFNYKNIIFALDLNGSFIQGGIAYGKVNNTTKVFFDSKVVPVSRDGSFIIGFSRDNKPSSTIKLIYDNGKVDKKLITIKKRNYKIQRINNIEKKKVTPPENYYKRIKNESILVKEAKKIFFDFPYYKRGFEMPVQGIITGVYGSQRILNGETKRPHYGIDIANKEGTVILSPSDGVVVLSEKDLYFSGGTIIISHGMGLTSSLLHLSKILVSVGDIVKKGDEVAYMGSTGRSTGPHLDWRMELRGVRIDPEIVLGLGGISN
ncbi:MAG: peptidase [Rickettsiales bacterium]|nr:peptidase [Rickettsiales bacterium]